MPLSGPLLPAATHTTPAFHAFSTAWHTGSFYRKGGAASKGKIQDPDAVDVFVVDAPFRLYYCERLPPHFVQTFTPQACFRGGL